MADALAVVFFSGVLFLILTVTRVREQIVNGMPDCLKHSTAVGIGMFIAFVGLRNAKLVVANPATFVGLGSFADKEFRRPASDRADPHPDGAETKRRHPDWCVWNHVGRDAPRHFPLAHCDLFRSRILPPLF